MRRTLVLFFILVVVLIELRHYTGDNLVYSNLSSALSDSVQELRDRTVGKAASGAETLGNRAQDGAWKAVARIQSNWKHAQQQLVDGSITAAVKMKLVHDDLVPASEIQVHTNDGVVQLTGTVKRPEEASRAAALAWKADGVRQVISRIAVSQALETQGEKTS